MSSRKMLTTFNANFIALFPKSNNLSFFEEYRLISLCNCIYKTSTVIIAMREKRLLSNLISNE
jgi:hypothetical protein